ncbi:MAG: hypothetical protein QXI89_02215, partial [Candidatus Anstonellales archaeon]
MSKSTKKIFKTAALSAALLLTPFINQKPLLERKQKEALYYSRQELSYITEPVLFFYEGHGEAFYSIEASKAIPIIKKYGFDLLFLECLDEHEGKVKAAHKAFAENKADESDERIDKLRKLLENNYVMGTADAYLRLIKAAAESQMEVACIDVKLDVANKNGKLMFKDEKEAVDTTQRILFSRELHMLDKVMEEIKKGRKVAIFIGFLHATSDYGGAVVKYFLN